MGYPSKAVANHILDIASGRGSSVTPMKLLKLLYFAHGWHLALKDSALLNESIEAWRFGPVVPSVYHAFKQYGTEPITDHATDLDLEAWMKKGEIKYVECCLPSDHTLGEFFDKIWEVYGGFSALQLSTLTHQPDTPWFKTWFELGGKDKKGADIPDGLIKEYFLQKSKN
ncbi:MAG: type II toxin-antitoxin system antitoxin SocA domain-containing protein [Verrucomicrobiia bacterium]|jgi:uncharacterized phage-associated protein